MLGKKLHQKKGSASVREFTNNLRADIVQNKFNSGYRGLL